MKTKLLVLSILLLSGCNKQLIDFVGGGLKTLNPGSVLLAKTTAGSTDVSGAKTISTTARGYTGFQSVGLNYSKPVITTARGYKVTLGVDNE